MKDRITARFYDIVGRTRTFAIYLTCLLGAAGIFWLALATYITHFSPRQMINIVAGLVPPNMNEDGSGREADIIRAALALGRGKVKVEQANIRFHVEPFARHWYSYRGDDRFDAVATVPTEMSLVGHESNSYITYRNGIGTLGDGPPVVGLEQLRGKRVVSFAGASQVIPGLSEQVRGQRFALYVERPDQRTHSWMLLKREVDAVIADALIFAEFNGRIFRERSMSERVQFSTGTFEPTCYKMVFRNAEHRDVFDDGLRRMLESGTLYEIDQRYVSERIKEWNVQYVASEGRRPCQGN